MSLGFSFIKSTSQVALLLFKEGLVAFLDNIYGAIHILNSPGDVVDIVQGQAPTRSGTRS